MVLLPSLVPRRLLGVHVARQEVRKIKRPPPLYQNRHFDCSTRTVCRRPDIQSLCRDAFGALACGIGALVATLVFILVIADSAEPVQPFLDSNFRLY